MTGPTSKPPSTPSHNSHPNRRGESHSKHLPAPRRRRSKLSRGECVFASLVFIFWLVLFVGGITVDTRPYRCLISPGGVAALEREGNGNVRSDSNVRAAGEPPVCEPPNFAGANMWYGKLVSWLVVLLMFLPVNLALVCSMAGILGIAGNIANLSDDRTSRPAQDNSNPYISAMLRGFFVYLFLISGLLLLDTNPFSNPTPGQYIRLAGFLSIFSFVVNYQPNIFNTIIIWAFNRIEAREVQPPPQDAEIDITHIKTTHERTAIHAGRSEADGADRSEVRELSTETALVANREGLKEEDD
jgi:cell division protein FtsL